MTTVSDYLRQLKEKGLAKATVSSYRFVLRNFVDIPLNKQAIERYQRQISHYQAATKRGCLEKLIRYLKETKPELIKHVIIPKVPKRVPKDIPSQVEVKEILQQPDLTTFEGIRDRAMLELFYSTGLRKKELLNLKVEDIDSVKQLVRVNEGKNNKDRIVPISKQSLLWVRKYIEKVRPTMTPKCNMVFVNRFGWEMSVNHPYVRVRRYSKNGCHKYRHAYATHLLQNGMKETSLQRLLGHALIATTQIYTKVTINDLKASYIRYHPRDRWRS